MQQDLKEIEEIKEHNQKQGAMFDVWPVIFFIFGLVVAAMAYNHTFA